MIEKLRWMAHHQNNPWPAWAIRAMYDGEIQHLYQAFPELKFVNFDRLIPRDPPERPLGMADNRTLEVSDEIFPTIF